MRYNECCWHCELPGHQKRQCVDWFFQLATCGLTWGRGYSAATEAKVHAEAKRLIIEAIGAGKKGDELLFMGRPGCLVMEWPAGCGTPKYPTRGVVDCGAYMGDDG
eukprot:Selendium_serpulae@DN4980_c0_g1_i7.p2